MLCSSFSLHEGERRASWSYMLCTGAGPSPKGPEGGCSVSGRQSSRGGCRFPQMYFSFSSLHSATWRNWVFSDHVSGLWTSRQDSFQDWCLLQLLVPFTCAWLLIVSYENLLQSHMAGLLLTINQPNKDLFWTLPKPSEALFHTQSRGCGNTQTTHTYLPSEEPGEQEPQIIAQNHKLP